MFQIKIFDLIADNNTTTKFQNLYNISTWISICFNEMNTSESASPQVQSSIMTHRLYKENLNHF